MWFQNRRARSIKSGRLTRPVKRGPGRAVSSSANLVLSVPQSGPALLPSFVPGQRNRPERYQASNRNSLKPQEQESSLDWVKQALGPWSQNLPRPIPPAPPIIPDLPGALSWKTGPVNQPTPAVSIGQMVRPIQTACQQQWSEFGQVSTSTTFSGGFSGSFGKPQCNININSGRHHTVSVDQTATNAHGYWEGAALMHYPQTSLADISDLIYSAAVVTNLADF